MFPYSFAGLYSFNAIIVIIIVWTPHSSKALKYSISRHVGGTLHYWQRDLNEWKYWQRDLNEWK